MAHSWTDAIHTTSLTPRDFQVELLASARERNLILCLAHNSNKEFIALKLIHELGFQLRSTDQRRKRTLYISNNDSVYSLMRNLTDLKVVHVDGDDPDWERIVADYQVIIADERKCLDAVVCGYLELDEVNLLVIDECHKIYGNVEIAELFSEYYERCRERPKILGLAGPLHNAGCIPGRLSAELEQLERCLKAKAETASDIVTVLRYCTKPKELILQCAPPQQSELALYLREIVETQMTFLQEHRYDPSEIYEDDEFLEELKHIPDPKVDPLNFLREFLTVLDEMGPWCADRAALALIVQIEKRKIKTPYERHFLLLCLVSTVFVQIRSYCDLVFQQYATELERIEAHSTPKVLRMLEIFRLFRPDGANRSTVSSKAPIKEVTESCQLPSCQSLLKEIKTVDFQNLLYEAVRSDPQLSYINVQYTVDKSANPITEPKEAEVEHRKQEEVLKRFRMHECNLLIGTSVLEEGIDLPKCNLVIRWNEPVSYRSYVQCKGRARAPSAYHILIVTPKVDQLLAASGARDDLSEQVHRRVCERTSRVKMEEEESDDDDEEKRPTSLSLQVMENCTNEMIEKIAIYMEIEKLLLRKCENMEPPESELKHADCFSRFFEIYRPLPETEENSNGVGLANAIQMINKYCAKLPSDTFTKLTPLWRCAKTTRKGHNLYQYTIRMPINSPLKEDILGLPMPTEILARRMAAYIACRVLHNAGEIDDTLHPIGKESFRAFEADWEDFELESIDAQIVSENSEPRPGTTKRRQYYYKRIASAFSECRPTVGCKVYLYHINMTLQCPIPEEQNTRGRRIYPPEDSPQGFGILTAKLIPKVSAFPIFTRSGEVKVALNLCAERTILNQEQLDKINLFINYTFTKVLRLQKYLMLYDPMATENCFFIVPTITRQSVVTVDWDFIDIIAKSVDKMPTFIPDENRTNYTFDNVQFRDAVVMPWYRNQDQPQYFYVAEICYHLSPKSSFPGLNYSTFEEYYYKKYNIQIQNCKQPLLDVDHTSARLNFLTPRYVNRKGVALPTSSEETKRAKRENLEQKQILIPELCTIHPFPASLWRAAVCLPCILYRINALLLADEIRKEVAHDLGLGATDISDAQFEWPILNFGWSLADVLKKSREAKLTAKAVLEEVPEVTEPEETEKKDDPVEGEADGVQKSEDPLSDEKTANDMLEEADAKLKTEGFQIGTWSNEMAESVQSEFMDDGENWGLPGNVNICSRNRTNIRYGSPTSWDVDNKEQPADARYYSDSEGSYGSDDDLDSGGEENDSDQGRYGLKIEFKSDNVAEAIESEDDIMKRQKQRDIINSTNLNEQLYQTSKNAREMFSTGLMMKTLRNQTKDNQKRTLPSVPNVATAINGSSDEFSFDYQPDLTNHPGPSPSIILQALTMSNANDGINLERLETIGDSFLKYAITTYLYCTYENVHEGKLSHLRSKQVSNLNLYRLGRRKVLGESMIATKFEPHDNWLPPCYYVPKELEQALIDAKIPACHWNLADLPDIKQLSSEEICKLVKERAQLLGLLDDSDNEEGEHMKEIQQLEVRNDEFIKNSDYFACFIPYNLVTQHSIPDKSVADCVEALIGAYLIECGPRGALLLMAWLGIRVLPVCEQPFDPTAPRIPGSSALYEVNGKQIQSIYGYWIPPRSPLLTHAPNPEKSLEHLLDGYNAFEDSLGYRFQDRSYLLQAMTHASYCPNRLTDCYQRLEFLGDAVLDYLITRHLYEDPRQHSPGALTDLRSALVNNTIFASLAVRHDFHKYFRHLSPGLNDVIDRFVRIQQENGHSISEEYYLISEDECDEAEDVEVPKALGDV
ncbi:hypothetical protein pipiens_008494, partial [Culex pipiens pipiens]